MTIHYAKDYRLGEILVSVDNRVATKVSVWVDGESQPRKRFASDTAYDDAMDFAFRLGDTMDLEPVIPTAESINIFLGGATFDSEY